MALFRRKRAAQGTEAATDPALESTSGAGSEEATHLADDAQSLESATAPSTASAATGQSDDPAPVPVDAAATGATGDTRDAGAGPFDVLDLPSREGLVDLGAILLPGIQGLVMSMEMDQNTGDVTAVRIHLGDSQLQLQAFAAPRSSGIWDEIREEIAEALGAQGGSSTEQEGPFGTELVVRVPGRGPDGRSVTSAMRFLGVDRPRWFLRGVISGPAAIDPEAARPLVDLMHVTVVDRGTEPMAPRELLPLRLPPEAPGSHEVGQAPSQDDEGAQEDPNVSTDDLRPFDRGPEITEIR